MENPFKDIVTRLDAIDNSIGLLNKTIQAKETDESPRTRHEAAKMLHVSLSTIDRLLKQHKLTKVKVGSKTLIPLKSIDKYLDRENRGTEIN